MWRFLWRRKALGEKKSGSPNIRLLGRFLLCEPNRKREQSVFLEKNSCMSSRCSRRHVDFVSHPNCRTDFVHLSQKTKDSRATWSLQKVEWCSSCGDTNDQHQLNIPTVSSFCSSSSFCSNKYLLTWQKFFLNNHNYYGYTDAPFSHEQ